MAQYKFLIKPENTSVAEYYVNHSTYNEGDSGLDLFVPEDITLACGETKFINLQIKCEMVNTFLEGKNVSYYLYARSSISKTPLMINNGVGVMDGGYRGFIFVAVHYSPTFEDLKQLATGKWPNLYTIKKGTRLVQICAPDLQPFSFNVVKTLSKTQRGEGCFGSTGK